MTTHHQARIAGTVEYREGDGPNIAIRPGPVEIEEAEIDATFSWVDGDSRGSASIPIADFRRYVDGRAIVLE